MKMKKLVALVTAGVLCLGMNMSVFAADGSNGSDNAPTPEEVRKEFEDEYNEGIAGIWTWRAPDYEYDLETRFLSAAKDDLTKEQYEEVVETFKDPAKVKEVIEAACNIPANSECKILVADDIRYGEYQEDAEGNMVWVDKEIPEGGIDMSVYVGSAAAEGLSDGDSIYVLHYVNGKWEVLEGTVKLDGDSAYVSVHFNSLSPVAFVKVTSSGKVVPYDEKGEPVTPAKTKSPKTGE